MNSSCSKEPELKNIYISIKKLFPVKARTNVIVSLPFRKVT